MNKKKLVGNILIIAGVVIIAVAVSMRIKAYYVQKAMVDTFQNTIENVDKTGEASSAPSTSNPKEAEETSIGGNVTAIVAIPKIDLKVAMSEGVDMETLKYAVGHFKGTADPGQTGNCCIAGHRSYTYSQYFNRLDEVKTGDEITIQTKNGTYTYVVYSTMVVEPSQLEVLDPTKDPELTLITCTPVRVATHRLIVKAKLK